VPSFERLFRAATRTLVSLTMLAEFAASGGRAGTTAAAAASAAAAAPTVVASELRRILIDDALPALQKLQAIVKNFKGASVVSAATSAGGVAAASNSGGSAGSGGGTAARTGGTLSRASNALNSSALSSASNVTLMHSFFHRRLRTPFDFLVAQLQRVVENGRNMDAASAVATLATPQPAAMTAFSAAIVGVVRDSAPSDTWKELVALAANAQGDGAAAASAGAEALEWAAFAAAVTRAAAGSLPADALSDEQRRRNGVGLFLDPSDTAVTMYHPRAASDCLATSRMVL